MRRSSALAVGVGLAILTHLGSAGAIRPTDGDGWFGNGYDVGVPVRSLPSPGGHFKVWWVESSLDAVQVGDVDGDGIPDFAQAVAEHADEVWVSTIDTRGFRPSLDDSVYHDTPDFGGDDRYDIYLQTISGSDGYRVTEVCTGVPYHCAGYYVMENDFAGFGYPSDDVGIRVLTSHEFFHAVQDAYDADQDRKWTEGTAVWNEEQIYPEQDDFEAFLPFFLDKPERPFERTGGSITDLYPYGAAIWAQFLTERYGPDVIREIWEACEDDGTNPSFLEATDRVLATGYGSSLDDAWLEFTQWNLFTAARADATRAYAAGADWPSVRLETLTDSFPLSMTVRSEGMSARYQPIALPDLAGRAARLTISVASRPVRGTAFLWDGVVLGDALPLAGADPNVQTADLTWTGTPTLYLVITGVIPGALPHDVTITLAEAPVDPPPPDEPEGCGCHAGPKRGTGAAGALLFAAALCAGLRARRRPGAANEADARRGGPEDLGDHPGRRARRPACRRSRR